MICDWWAHLLQRSNSEGINKNIGILFFLRGTSCEIITSISDLQQYVIKVKAFVFPKAATCSHMVGRHANKHLELKGLYLIRTKHDCALL